MALLHYDNAPCVVTAGADGHLRLWSLSDILNAAAAAVRAAAGPHVVLQATAEVLLPHLQNPVGVSDGRQPTAQVLAVDTQHRQVFVGERRGGGQQKPLDTINKKSNLASDHPPTPHPPKICDLGLEHCIYNIYGVKINEDVD
jgi:hypothetical protein